MQADEKHKSNQSFKPMKKIFSILAAIAFVFVACNTNKTEQQQVGTFELKRGVNLSHWLSQSPLRGQERADRVKEKDIANLQKWGFDHVRIPIDEEQMWDEEGNKQNEAWGLLTQTLNWCGQYGIRAIVDLHILRSHNFVLAEGEHNALYEDPAEQQKLIDMWYQLSDTLKAYPNNMVAYEFMNEPVAEDPEQWNQVVEKVHRALREREPERKLVIGSNMWQSVGTFKDLRVPKDDKNIILSFHYYAPMLLTHYHAGWCVEGKYDADVNYPGQLVTDSTYATLPDDVKAMVDERKFREVWDRDRIHNEMLDAIKLADSLKLQLFCGEWGVYEKVPREWGAAWIKDMLSVFDEENIAWTFWCYDADFGFWDQKTQDFKEKAIFDALVSGKPLDESKRIKPEKRG